MLLACIAVMELSKQDRLEDLPRQACRVHGGLKPAEITLLEFIVQANDRGIREPPFDVSGYSAVTAHVSSGYRNAFGLVMDKGLPDRRIGQLPARGMNMLTTTH